MSSFEQRLMSEIEFRLERTPVEESDEEVQHDDVPTGKCIAPLFDKKLKNFRAMEGVPVTFSCKIVGIPVPKVRRFHVNSPAEKQRNNRCRSSTGLLVQRWQADPQKERPLQEDPGRGRNLRFAYRVHDQRR